jgi:prepilin-type N-terminal cleavage/methylation domain-containing protein
MRLHDGFNRGFHRGPRGGFTLIEVAITTIILGLGSVAVLGLLSTGTGANVQAAQLTTAVHLADNIHEMCDQLALPSSGAWGIPNGPTIASLMTGGNITWLDGATGSTSYTFDGTLGANSTGPVDANNNIIPNMSDWQQVVSVKSVQPSNVTSLVSNNTTIPMANVTVTINYKTPEMTQPRQMFQSSWLVAR